MRGSPILPHPKIVFSCPPPPPQITLHQQDLERIDVINDECKELEILYLQNNLIPRIGVWL